MCISTNNKTDSWQTCHIHKHVVDNSCYNFLNRKVLRSVLKGLVLILSSQISALRKACGQKLDITSETSKALEPLCKWQLIANNFITSRPLDESLLIQRERERGKGERGRKEGKSVCNDSRLSPTFQFCTRSPLITVPIYFLTPVVYHFHIDPLVLLLSRLYTN